MAVPVRSAGVRILLPPSETKSVGGDGPPLALDRLSLPVLTDTRRRVAEALVGLCSGDRRTASEKLGIGPSLEAEIDHDLALWTSPTCPAVERYTGVLYDALDIGTWGPAERERALQRVYIGSALFGLVGAADPIPHYRLSAGSALPALGAGLRSVWRPALAAVAAEWEHEFVVDLRSGSYLQLGPVPGAVTVRVEAERPDGSRSVVSHHNKHHKGLLARRLATTRAEVRDVPSLLTVARRAGMRIDRDERDPYLLVMVVPA